MRGTGARLRAMGSALTAPPPRLTAPPRQGDPFYQSREWRDLVAAIKQARGDRCARCGSHHRVAGDHVQERRDGGAALDPANIELLCQACHNSKTAEVRQARGSGHRRPEWLRRSIVPVTLVCGPPAAGKSFWVMERAGPRDLVVDLDMIAARLAGATQHAWDREWLGAALRERNALLGSLSRPQARRWRWVWLIVSEPTAAGRQWWVDKLGVDTVVVLATPDRVCWTRIADDPERQPRRAEASEGVAQWWANYCPRPGDHLVVGGVKSLSPSAAQPAGIPIQGIFSRPA